MLIGLFVNVMSQHLTSPVTCLLLWRREVAQKLPSSNFICLLKVSYKIVCELDAEESKSQDKGSQFVIFKLFLFMLLLH